MKYRIISWFRYYEKDLITIHFVEQKRFFFSKWKRMPRAAFISLKAAKNYINFKKYGLDGK